MTRYGALSSVPSFVHNVVPATRQAYVTSASALSGTATRSSVRPAAGLLAGRGLIAGPGAGGSQDMGGAPGPPRAGVAGPGAPGGGGSWEGGGAAARRWTGFAAR